MLQSFPREIGEFFLRPARILQGYRLAYLRPDLLAGLTVAVLLLPQAIAYAQIAEMPPQTGLYAAITAAVVGALWGSSSHLHSGPTNAASLLMLSTLIFYFPAGSPEYIAAAGLMTLMVGLARLMMGVLRLGVIVNFVSDAVIIGFTAGAGILIAVNQLRHMLRLDIVNTPELYETLAEVGLHINESHLPTVGLSLGIILVMAVLRRFRPGWPAALIVMVLTSAVASFWGQSLGLEVLGRIPRTLPPIAKIPITNLRLIGQLSTGALAISAIGIVEAMSIARSISAKSGERINSNQEFVGQGLANIAAGIFSGFTCSGSFSRSSVLYEGGGKTALSVVFSGLWVLVAMLVFAPLARFIPKAALASVLIVTSYGMVDRKEMKRIWQSSVGDTLIMIATLLATLLLPLEFAVLSGMIVSFARYIVTTSTPEVYPVVPDANYQMMVKQDRTLPCLQLGVITIGGSLYFGATQHVEDRIYDNLSKHPEQRFLLLRMSQVDHMDISGIHMIEAVVRKYRSRGGDVFFSGMRETLKERMLSVGFDEFIGQGHYLSTRESLSHLFHKVLDPSVCIYECDRRVFAECQALPKYPYGISPEKPVEIPEHLVTHWLPSEVRRSIDHPAEDADPLLVDVREQSEYQNGHIPTTVLIPLRRIRTEGLSLPTDRPVVLVCRSGRRSTLAAIILQDLGYTNVFNMKGGMLAWEAAGYPVAVE